MAAPFSAGLPWFLILFKMFMDEDSRCRCSEERLVLEPQALLVANDVVVLASSRHELQSSLE